MGIIKDYWQKWLAGETTDNEVDTYIRSSFNHLVYEYKSVYFARCIAKQYTRPACPEATLPDPEKSPETRVVDAQATVLAAESLVAVAANPAPPQAVTDQKPDATVVATDTAEQEWTATEPATVTSTTESAAITACVCQQAPELVDLLQSYDQGEFEKDRKPTWDDCALMEVAISKLLDKHRLKIKLATLEARYEAVVDPKKFACYKQSTLRSGNDDEDIKERVYYLVWDLYWSYTTASKVGQLKQRAIKPILGLLPVIIATFLGFLFTYQLVNFFISTQVFSTVMIVLSVIFFGAFGGLISFQRRLSKLEVRGEMYSNYLQLCSLGNEGPLALFAGGFFALLLLVLFGSGLASAAVNAIFSKELADLVVPLFPQLYIKGKVSGSVLTLAAAIANLSFVGYSSIAKLLIWSFLAGFAEALIPDAMTRLIDKAKLMEK